MFEGLTVAMVTPFADGEMDLQGAGRLVDFMLEGGVEGLVVSGSTGEAATCTVEERRRLWAFVRERAGGRCAVIAGTGTNDTAASITLTRMAEELGMDGVMVVTPFYNKPTPKGQVAHFAAVARSTRLPVILYNVPGRTGTNTMPDTFARTQDVPNIVAIKEASGSLDQASALCATTRFTVLSGDDSLTLPMMAVGAKGVISVAGNVAPRAMRTLCDHAGAGRGREAETAHRALAPLFKALFIESNPAPAKFLLSAMGLIRNELRLPLVPVEPASEQIILAAARACDLALAAGGARVIALVLSGAAGRMGAAVEYAAKAVDDVRVRVRIDRAGGGGAGWSPDASAIAAGDVVVDFSSPELLRGVAARCAEVGAPLVTGTTGLDSDDERALSDAARRVAVVRAANFSLGVLALRRALATALASVPSDWDIEIIERHHRNKADSPSGTALLLARDATEVRGLPATALRHGRQGRIGVRPKAEVGMHAVRGGTWVGDHVVLVAGEGEWLELRHVAQDRTAFAHGALAAARFAVRSAPGLYTLDDIVGGRS